MRGKFAIITHKREAAANSPLIRPCGATFSLRAKSRLRRLRSDTRLRAQPLGGRLGAGCLPLRGKVAEAPPEAG
mgnify:CR=1 FL=1